MWWDRCLWSSTPSSTTTVSDVVLTFPYWYGYLTRLENIDQIIIKKPRTPSPLMLLVVRLLQLQEFRFRNIPVEVKVDNTLVKTAVSRVNLNLDGTPITSRTHTHTSHSETYRLLTSYLSLGVPVPTVPQGTQCVRSVDFSTLVFSLSSHRHWYIGLIFSSRFIYS